MGATRRHARSDYEFLLERSIDRATLDRAEALAKEVLARLEPHHLSLTSPDTLRQAVCGHFVGNLAASSVDGLHARFPDRSAKSNARNLAAPAALLASRGLRAALVLETQPAFRALSLALVFIFLPVIARRVFAACDLLRRACEACTAAHSGFRASALHHPRAALPRGQYARPAHRGGRAASLSRAMSRSWWCRTFTRAPSQRRSTTPAARDEYLVIYDAEDRPERDQCAKPSPRPPNLACLQAKLDLCNATDNWLTRLGAREFAVPSATDAGLLVADLRRRLSRHLAVRDRPLRLGEDSAQT